jgi:hypothetical protein
MTDIDVWVVSRGYVDFEGYPKGQPQIMGVYLDRGTAESVSDGLNTYHARGLDSGTRQETRGYVERTKLEVPDGFKL